MSVPIEGLRQEKYTDGMAWHGMFAHQSTSEYGQADGIHYYTFQNQPFSFLASCPNILALSPSWT